MRHKMGHRGLHQSDGNGTRSGADSGECGCAGVYRYAVQCRDGGRAGGGGGAGKRDCNRAVWDGGGGGGRRGVSLQASFKFSVSYALR